LSNFLTAAKKKNQNSILLLPPALFIPTFKPFL